jgi:pimeloyl-ACP methyl ester carboxylesterase
MMAFLIIFALLCGCASQSPPQQSADFLSQGLEHPSKIATIETPSRYWAQDNFVVHFISNVNEQNKSQVPIIYVHGLGGSLEGFLDLIKILHPAKTSRPYYALDLPPFGRSVMQKSDLSIQTYAALLQAFIAQLSVPKVDLVCHSMGGQVCIELALQTPDEVQLLTLISPAGTYDKSAFMSDLTNHFVGINVGSVDYPNARSIGDMSWYYPEFTRRMLTDNPLILVGVESFRENFHNRIQKLKTKTLIIWGRDDLIFNYENGLYLKANIENSTLYIVEGAGHTSFSTHHAVISELIKKHL